jgi:uncharacterized protein (DUF934 family)
MRSGNKCMASDSFCLRVKAGTVLRWPRYTARIEPCEDSAMPRLIRNRTIVDDRYTLLREAASLADVPDGVPVIVPLALWIERRAALIARGEAGVWLAPADDPGVLVDDIRRLPLIAIDFPPFADSRGHAHARVLRGTYAFANELRAIGDVRRDQFDDLAQSGFDSVAIAGAPRAEIARDDFAHFRCEDESRAVAPRFTRESRGSPGDVGFPCA